MAASFSPSYSPRRHPHSPFTPIQECETENEETESCDQTDYYVHQPTPLHQTSKSAANSSKKRVESRADDRRVFFNKCRPTVREKFSVVPLDTSTTNASPNGLLKSIFSLVNKTPRSSTSSSSEQLTPVAELSNKLIHVTKNRDEAILDASRLKFSVTELENKLNKLEIYCRNLKSGLDDCTNKSDDIIIEHFLISVSESRSSMRHLSRSLTAQLPQIDGGKLYDRIQLLLQPYDVKISALTNPRILIMYLEALMNRVFFEDFESAGFKRSGSVNILNPVHKCEENYKCFMRLKELSWEEVLNNGTKQFSEEFSKFCDRKMSEVVGMLGWTRAWPEQLLEAFFGACKAVWLVYLLANSVHPGLPVFRVDKGVRFDPVYMEDTGGDKARKFALSSTVRVMVEPGFYIYGNVVKCKVICKYHIHGSPNMT